MSWEIWNMNFRNGPMINFNVTEIQNRETNVKQLMECWNKWNDYSKTLPSVQQDQVLKIWLLFHHFFENFLSLAYLQQRQWRDKPQRWVRKDSWLSFYCLEYLLISVRLDNIWRRYGIPQFNNQQNVKLTFATTSPSLSAFFSLMLCWENFYLRHTYLKRMFVAPFCNHLTDKNST